ncbi:tripartite tricarboxylate transporter substrate binding protein [Verminephrobacter aporrectodeae subsp. tuberculatae]|uniref:Tripartite tricarboxylate transporter substrate binding protein n=1 Tax=Verminephrobacter aporrectodeae subsp. tuberculatae TaxID=1110392 RepID=A0ABT3KQ98_9BURK|nr:tripartite tricarboxylate transporter substrate binding protein [Verminephrobacter aporrectodeae]MCW5220570.1 tripartite tricarboxylate transporter substrate binding protein [Verminephrobacter aporrectodeae subsp. tuberculatae]MCW5289866.1 tripartite tricarboxylate transporter substrate binding protein [Verminephrobacter aporrectodeae subsp. tuberculatae]MCW5320455.1 tripartite tricarboxylate transporter substrate binding protein [Verminephrobacter aporrectodeae subsp. tuberculatae]
MQKSLSSGVHSLILGTAAVAAALAGGAQAQDSFPSKPITLVVPYPPGGSNDVFARTIARELGDVLRQPVIVDNRPGASGTTGTAAVSRAPADGYTLVAVSSSMTTNAAVQPKMSFDPEKGLTPVAMFADGPFIVAVNNSFPARNPQELIAAIRARPGVFNYASSGSGSVNQFGTELLKSQAGRLFITHIPYRGMGPAVTDLISGQTQVLMASGPSLLPMVRAGKVRAVGITSAQPSAIAPDLVPFSSAVTGYDFSLWWGLLAPSGTPASVVEKLNAAVNQVLAKPEVRERFLREGAQVKPMTPAQFGTIIAADIGRWKQLAKQQNILAD